MPLSGMSTVSRQSAVRAARPRWLWGLPILLALGLLVAWGLTVGHRESRLVGTNSVPLRGPAVGLAPGLSLCQPGQVVPKGAGRMQMFLSPAQPGQQPEVDVTIRRPGEGTLVRAAGRYRPPGGLDVPIATPIRRTILDGEVCLRNTGAHTVVLSGILTPFGNVMYRGKRLDTSLTTLWYEPHARSWLGELGAIIPRVGHARTGGVWAFWGASLLLLAALALALGMAIRESTR
jgi:hypothetical protein